jgi:hypothetical protein
VEGAGAQLRLGRGRPPTGAAAGRIPQVCSPTRRAPTGSTRRHVVTGGHTWSHPARSFNRLIAGS